MSHKPGIEKAMFKYLQKIEGKNNREPSRRNKKPERDTEKAVLAWGRSNGFHFHVVESSSYNPITGGVGIAKADPGFPDVVGNTSGGHSAWVELKAKDRRSSLSDIQRVFLTAKINQNCFAVVVDSDERLDQYWKGFSSLKTPKEKQAYLLDCLPKQLPQRGKKRINDEFGF